MEQKEEPKTIIFTGNSNNGKTKLLYRVCEDSFLDEYSVTSMEFKDRLFEKNSFSSGNINPVTIRFYDIAGQEDFGCIQEAFYSVANIVFVCCPVNNVAELQFTREKILPVVQFFKEEHCKIFLLATKSDLEENISVEFNQKVQEIKNEYDINYFVTSAKKGTGCEEVMKKAMRCLVDCEKNEKPKKVSFCCCF